jgi:antitoxin ParD1/3/4
MNVNLPQDLDDFVAEQLREGGYSNQSEIVREGLRLLRQRTQNRRLLRDHLAAGLADIAEGRTKPLTDELLVDIANRGQQRSIARKAKRS